MDSISETDCNNNYLILQTVVSNDKKKSVIFKPTKPIAPSEFTVFMGNHRNKSRIITHNGTDITIGIYSPPPVKQYTWKIIRALSKSLHYLFNYFDLTPLDKLGKFVFLVYSQFLI